MNYYIVILTSVTAAKRAQKILERNRVSCFMIRTPSEISEYGCSNSLKIRSNDIDKTIGVLNKMDFNIRGIYKENCNDKECKYIKF